MIKTIKNILIGIILIPLVIIIVLISLVCSPFILVDNYKTKKTLKKFIEANQGSKFLLVYEREKTKEIIESYIEPLSISQGFRKLESNDQKHEWSLVKQRYLGRGTPWLISFENKTIKLISLSGFVGYLNQSTRTEEQIEEKWKTAIKKLNKTA